MDQLKKCSTCQKYKANSDFHKGEYRCKPCMKIKNKKYKSNNKEKISEYNKEYVNRPGIKEKLSQNEKDRWANDRRNQTKRHRLWKYNLTEEELLQIETESNNQCAICTSKERLCIDHDHQTGIIRGMLCHLCNSALGKFKDNPILLQNAIDYLDHSNDKFFERSA